MILPPQVEVPKELTLVEQAAQVDVLEKDTETVRNLVRQHRMVRLDQHAKKSRWSVQALPAEVRGNPEAQQWWQEWRDQRVQVKTLEAP